VHGAPRQDQRREAAEIERCPEGLQIGSRQAVEVRASSLGHGDGHDELRKVIAQGRQREIIEVDEPHRVIPADEHVPAVGVLVERDRQCRGQSAQLFEIVGGQQGSRGRSDPLGKDLSPSRPERFQ
jgi:hypothetical protein